MDARTIRAAVAAFLLLFAGFAGVGVFLGFGDAPAVVTGLVLGGLAGLLILAVARRAEGRSLPGTDDPA